MKINWRAIMLAVVVVFAWQIVGYLINPIIKDIPGWFFGGSVAIGHFFGAHVQLVGRK